MVKRLERLHQSRMSRVMLAAFGMAICGGGLTQVALAQGGAPAGQTQDLLADQKEQALKAQIEAAREARRKAHDAYVASLKSADAQHRAATKARLDAEHQHLAALRAQWAALKKQRQAEHLAYVNSLKAQDAKARAATAAKDQAADAKEAANKAALAQARAQRNAAKHKGGGK